jgi:predicted SnoaL-like aldol condensation-catalyzing enzyme
MHADYMQHNPNVDTGRDGFVDFIRRRGEPQAVPPEIPGLVSIQAEGDMVTFSLVNEIQGPNH